MAFCAGGAFLSHARAHALLEMRAKCARIAETFCKKAVKVLNWQLRVDKARAAAAVAVLREFA
jgi:hypothetical protein